METHAPVDGDAVQLHQLGYQGSQFLSQNIGRVALGHKTGDIVAFSPPLIISEAEIDEMMSCFGKALDDTWAMVREKGLA